MAYRVGSNISRVLMVQHPLVIGRLRLAVESVMWGLGRPVSDCEVESLYRLFSEDTNGTVDDKCWRVVDEVGLREFGEWLTK